MKTNVKTLSLLNLRSYLFAALFTVGNIILPQTAHLIPDGGRMFLPVYFFTLVAAFRYGWQVGLLVGLCSPVINNLLFGMPTGEMLAVILIKSSLLALFAALVSKKVNTGLFISLALVILAYQLTGSVAEWAITGSFTAASQDLTLGLPGMAFQLFGGYIALKLLQKHGI